MRARPPVTRVDAGQLTVRTDLISADGTALAPLEVSLSSDHADLLDPTATPAVPVLVALAAARGEDLFIEASVDTRMATGAAELARSLCRRWDTGETKVDVAGTHDSVSPGAGVGLLFTRGVDSWSTLLDAREDRPVTHLLSVSHDPNRRAIDAEILLGHRQVADAFDLTLVVLTTSARTLLEPHQPWAQVTGPALISAGLVAGTGIDRLVLGGGDPDEDRTGTGSDPALFAALSTAATTVVSGGPHGRRHERVARLLGDRRARSTLQTCEQGRSAANCGRCPKCLTVMSALVLAGDPDPGQGFDASLDLGRVRELRLTPDDDDRDLADELARSLPPEQEELRRAWADMLTLSRGLAPLPRWGDQSPPPMAGPGVPERVAAALTATTGRADATPIAPLGWKPRTVGLRPALTDHDAVRARAAEAPRRPLPWAVIEHHVRAGRQDGHQAALALLGHDAFGPGLVYLPGILWAPDQPPLLDRGAVAVLLGRARARFWWRAEGDLEPLRLVETIEHGCLPIQVMPAGPARQLAAELPPALAALVVPEGALDQLDLSSTGVEDRLAPAVDLLLAGSAEHGLTAGALGG